MGEVKGYAKWNEYWDDGDPYYPSTPDVYMMKVTPCIGVRGFYFCEELADLFNDYDYYPTQKIIEIVALGEIVSHNKLCCTNKIRIVREIPWDEVQRMVNTGRGCTGRCNSGNYNTGDYNAGNRNTGSHNTGDFNTGSCNAGSHNTGGGNIGCDNSGHRNVGWHNAGNENLGRHNVGNCNIGGNNTGRCNVGNFNVGKYNTGSFNTGDCNIGDYNTGDWNKSSHNNGCFMTKKDPEIYMFDQPSSWTYDD